MSYIPDPHVHRLDRFVLVASSFMYCTLIMHLAPQVEAVQYFCMGFQLDDLYIPMQSNFLVLYPAVHIKIMVF